MQKNNLDQETAEIESKISKAFNTGQTLVNQLNNIGE